jgi:serine/threonine-protein kinase
MPLLNNSFSADDLTGDTSFSDDAVISSLQNVRRWFSGERILRSAKAIPWTHLSVLTFIVGAGLITSEAVRSAIQLGVITDSDFIRFLNANVTTMVVGFGFAIYGCVVNRRLQRRIRTQEQLGPYTLHQLIGSGGMGDVYLAEHQLLKRKCAVKLIRRDKAANRRMLARFEREVKATAQLTHWNTVQVYDYGRTPDGTFYYAMEYLEGLNLRQLVAEHGALPPGRVVFILQQLCGALHEAARYGLVHRDIKPSNIFLAERGQMYDIAKLLDFGLVRPASFGACPIRNVSHQLQGSPRFMCPEQAQGQKPDCRGDLYSLACVAYFLLSGRAPFEDENPVMLVVAHASIAAPSFEEIGVHVPADLASIVMTCLSKNPDARIQTPRQLQEALDACDCARDWTWRDAERWWLAHPTETHHLAGEQTSVAIETRPGGKNPAAEPDATLVCANASRDLSHF